MNEAHEVDGLFLITSGDAAETLDRSKESLDDIAMFVPFFVIALLHPAGRVRTDADFPPGFSNLLTQIITVIGGVRDHMFRGKTSQKFRRSRSISRLPGSEQQSRGTAKTIDRCVQLRGQSSS